MNSFISNFRMKKFIFKSLIFIVPFVLIFSLPMIFNFVFNTEIENKINSLIKNKNERLIIIAGDSRAERHIVPQKIEDKFGIKTINIGVSGGDLHILLNSLKKYNINNPENILLVSSSSWQVNINALKSWGVSHSKVTEMPMLMQLRLYGKDIITIYHERLIKIIEEIFSSKSDRFLSVEDNRNQTSGFYAEDGTISKVFLDTVNIYNNDVLSEWYGSSKDNIMGIQVFKNSIENLNKMGFKTIFIKSPFAPSWIDIINTTYIDSIESIHTDIIKEFVNNNNCYLIDFYTEQDEVFVDSMFYGVNHLNNNGAIALTEMIIDSLDMRKLIE